MPSSNAAHPIGFYDIGDLKAEATKVYKNNIKAIGRSSSSTWFNM